MLMMASYQIQVFFSGEFIAEHKIEAASALSAINLVEANYGEPPEVAYKTIYHEDGTKERILVVSSWHGYTFLARDIDRWAG
jgi:hypothetical protein